MRQERLPDDLMSGGVVSAGGMPGTDATGGAADEQMEMPTLLELHRSGRKALVKAIHQWGGREEVARRLGLACSPCASQPTFQFHCTMY